MPRPHHSLLTPGGGVTSTFKFFLKNNHPLPTPGGVGHCGYSAKDGSKPMNLDKPLPHAPPHVRWGSTPTSTGSLQHFSSVVCPANEKLVKKWACNFGLSGDSDQLPLFKCFLFLVCHFLICLVLGFFLTRSKALQV